MEIVSDLNNNEFELTPDEIKFMKILRKLDKLNSGRITLFANGRIDARINGVCYENSFESFINIKCDGGDGGDNF